jgi:hypothetical protein
VQSPCNRLSNNYTDSLTAKLLLALASIMILDSKYHGANVHVLLSALGAFRELSPDSDYALPADPRYVVSERTTQKTPLLVASLLLLVDLLLQKCVCRAVA